MYSSYLIYGVSGSIYSTQLYGKYWATWPHLVDPILIERPSLSGSSVSSYDPGRVLCDPPVVKYADPVAEMTMLPLMKGFSVFLRGDYSYTHHYSPIFSKCKFVAFEEVEPSRPLIAYTWQDPLGSSGRVVPEWISYKYPLI